MVSFLSNIKYFARKRRRKFLGIGRQRECDGFHAQNGFLKSRVKKIAIDRIFFSFSFSIVQFGNRIANWKIK
jgi:hypothetical protein